MKKIEEFIGSYNGHFITCFKRKDIFQIFGYNTVSLNWFEMCKEYKETSLECEENKKTYKRRYKDWRTFSN